MLFLLNNQVLELELPEHRLARRWRVMGCGDPHAMRAREAVDFARSVVDAAHVAGEPLGQETALDLAALIVAKTGANAAQFVPRASGTSEARINTFAEPVLDLFRRATAADTPAAASPWTSAVA